MIEAAAAFVPANVISFTSVSSGNTGRPANPRAVCRRPKRIAAVRGGCKRASAHPSYAGRKYSRVVALLDEHYDELWVGGKAS